MWCPFMKVLRLPIMALALLTAGELWAADPRFQAIFSENLSVAAGKSTDITINLMQRLQDDENGPDQYLTSISVERTIANGVELGIGGTHHRIGAETENRPYQRLIITSGALSSRTQLEQRLFETGPDIVWRVRERIQYSQALDSEKCWSLIASGELLFTLNHRSTSAKTGLDQYRGELGLRRRLSHHLYLQAGYLRQHNFRLNRPDTLINGSQLTLGWRL